MLTHYLLDLLQMVLFLLLLLLFSWPLSLYLLKVYSGEKNLLSPLFSPLEKKVYRLSGLNQNPNQSQNPREGNWIQYAQSLLTFSLVSLIITYLILRTQSYLPFNTQQVNNLSHSLAFNTAISFLTNTNWQSYSGETDLSYFSQMVALTYQNFISPAVGLCAALVLIRGLSREQTDQIGNFWVDLLRTNLYLLLPLSLIFAFILMSQGMIQNLLPYSKIITLEGSSQLIPQGPVASQVAIKMLGTNGGGFFNANGAHPFENPTPLSNFLQMLSIFLIPSALIFLLGHMTKNKKHAWTLWMSVALVFVVGTFIITYAEYKGNPLFTQLGSSSTANMEGKEVRFGIFHSSLFASLTTSASSGATNSLHTSFTPLSTLVLLNNMLLGEIIFGGVGSGLYGLLMHVFLTVFISGLMIGRTPEYLGKKIQGREVQFIMIAIIVSAFFILLLTSWGLISQLGRSSMGHTGPHGFMEVFYAHTSAAVNNGSAFTSLSTKTPFWDYSLGVAMFYGRYFTMIPMLAVSGAMAKKKIHPQSEGSLPLEGPLFALLLICILFLIGALTYFPALTLGPILELLL